MSNIDLKGRTAVVTGASNGLGEATAKVLAAAGATVIMGVRDLGRGRAAADRIRAAAPHAKLELGHLELESLASVREFAHLHTCGGIDILVNNAGLTPGDERAFTEDGFEQAMGVNHFGHFLLTSLLLPPLLRSDHARVVHLGSLMIRAAGSLDLRFGESGPYSAALAYSQSKLACALFGFELDRRAKAAGSHLTSVVAHPGWSGTNLFSQPTGGKLHALTHRVGSVVGSPPEKGARSQIRAACDRSMLGGEYVGPRFGSHGRPSVITPPAASRDPHAASLLWESSEEKVGTLFQLK